VALTPQDIVRKEFREAFRGYNQADVDLFLDEVVEEFQRTYEENQKMKVRLAALQQEVARLREGRTGEAAPAASEEDAARLEGEVRDRVRRFLEDQIRMLDAASAPRRSATIERIARDVPPPPDETAEAEDQQEREPFWAGE